MKPEIDIKHVAFSVKKSGDGKELCYQCSVQVNDLTYNTHHTTPTRVSPEVLLNFLIETAKNEVKTAILKNMEQHRL